MSKNIRIILQARLSSSRLPAKMLLPVAGMPLVVLGAKRAMTSGLPVIVATTTDRADDLMAAALTDYAIPFIRGDLENVLSRFLLATEDMDDDDLIVRLTGDNPLVDGPFINDMIAFHESAAATYTRSLSPFDGLPYGMSAEVIQVKELRRVGKSATSAHDREHVTSYLTSRGEYRLYKSPLKEDLSFLRVTVDNFADYERVAKLFEGEEPVSTSWQALIKKLRRNPATPRFRTPYTQVGSRAESRFALGTAQLGMPYGIANRTGQPPRETAKAILDYALAHGVTLFDTAAAYGASEKVIGECLSAAQKQDVAIHTKLDPLASLEAWASAYSIDRAVEASIYKSCHDLGLQTLPCVILHRWAHYNEHDQAVWKRLKGMKKDGLIKKLGASVQSPAEALAALEVPEIEFIQIAFNICDWRWRESGFIKARTKRSDIHVQARSALLQGVLTLPSREWPALPETQAGEIAQALQALVKTHKRKSVPDLAYAYVRGMDWINSVVVGVETLDQLKENLDLFNEPPLGDPDSIMLPAADVKFLDPAQWPKGKIHA